MWQHKNIIKHATLLITILMLQACAQEPLPESKEAYIGVWQSQGGFQIQILPEGFANIYQPIDSTQIEYTSLRIEHANKEFNFGFRIEFPADSIIAIDKPNFESKHYVINKKPFLDQDTMKMVLNGVVLRKYNEDNFLAGL